MILNVADTTFPSIRVKDSRNTFYKEHLKYFLEADYNSVSHFLSSDNGDSEFFYVAMKRHRMLNSYRNNPDAVDVQSQLSKLDNSKSIKERFRDFLIRRRSTL